MTQVYKKPQPNTKPKLSKNIEEIRDQLDMFHNVAKLFEDHPKLMKGLSAIAIGAVVVSLFTKSRD